MRTLNGNVFNVNVNDEMFFCFVFFHTSNVSFTFENALKKILL